MLRRLNPELLAPLAWAAVVTALALHSRFSDGAPSLRATIDTLLMLCALASASFMWARFCRRGSSFDLLLLIAVLTLTLEDFAFFAAPAMIGSHAASSETVAPLTAQLVVALTFAAAAFASRRDLVPVRRGTKLLFAILVLYATALAVTLLSGGGPSRLLEAASAPHVISDRSILLTAPAIVLLVVAAYGFMRSALRDRDAAMAGMLGGSSLLLAAAWVYDLLSPDLTATSISGREVLRAAAYALILMVALKCREQVQRAQIGEVAAAERRRVIRDVHDGMAQDLAFIVVHGERLARELGPNHPLVVAARRALSASRGVIADLSAADAPTTADALQAIATELASRHNVQVSVQVDGDDLAPADREEVVRITREAVVNAVWHGSARNISIFLDARGARFRLVIRDDGTGVDKQPDGVSGNGYGLRAMRERAAAIGGELSIESAPSGGTAVEVSVS